ncbi:MAG: iron-sulfur cluster assembly accessory protein [Nanoarchaeota archaeon]|nr:iron-sulfur cluster assembly accessory protein [Nanoarchaeota archaeon]
MATKKSITNNGITEDMTIATIFEHYPAHVSKLAEKMLEYGLHCVGCHVNRYESIKEGSTGHGMPTKEFQTMLKELNAIITTDTTPTTGIILTKKATEKLNEIMKKEKKEKAFLRINIIAGGCSGNSYDLQFEKKKNKEDIIIKHEGITIIIDKESMKKMEGSTIDYIEGLQASGFKINNPNIKKSCGCGSSFS